MTNERNQKEGIWTPENITRLATELKAYVGQLDDNLKIPDLIRTPEDIRDLYLGRKIDQNPRWTAFFIGLNEELMGFINMSFAGAYHFERCNDIRDIKDGLRNPKSMFFREDHPKNHRLFLSTLLGTSI